MPSTALSLLEAAGIKVMGTVRWGALVPAGGPGVYIVSLAANPAENTDTIDRAPVDLERVRAWLVRVPGLELDHIRSPSVAALAGRLARYWLLDESAIYIGCTRGSLRNRIGAFYRTPLGDPNPHAGGYWLKTLCPAVLGATHVHFALSEDPERDEIAVLDAFTRELSPQSRQRLHAERFQLPFANLERKKGERKLHGIGRPHVPGTRLAP